MQSNQVSLTVKVNGRPVAEYQHEGRQYVEGREGTPYSLHLKNENPFRVKVVPSVDGVNVLGGKPATGAPDEIGYVLEAYQSFTCDGYRLDNDSVAAFTFTAADKAYAQKEKKLEGTTGVIGLRVWTEQAKHLPAAPVTVVERHDHHHYHERYPWVQPVYPTYPSWGGGWGGSTLTCGDGGSAVSYNMASSQGAAGCGLNSAGHHGTVLSACNLSSPQGGAASGGDLSFQSSSNPFTLGSTFGAKVQSKVVDTTFTSDRLLVELTVYYSTRDGLQALGVDMTRTDKVAFPQAFGGQYCTPPSGWKG